MSQTRRAALFLDDDADILAAAELALRRHGYDMTGVQTPEDARARLDAGKFDIILLDLNFRRGDTSGDAGLTFLEEQKRIDPETPVVVITGHSGLSIAVRAMRLGAEDFVVKPWHNERLVATLNAAVEQPRVRPAPPGPQDLNLERSERELIKEALNRHEFNISHAAKELGLTRAALYRRMEKHGL
ncbi:MAG: DNA-binding response regulator [Asticcacaulis sp.]|nr:DNA-binding response regulator [Asticcacaulis sp.]